jgi:16S rRNA (uracil1498-N3)-methyltransferase
MHRIFLPPDQIDRQSGHVNITGQDHVHLSRVLRVRAGECVVVLDGQGSAYEATLTTIGKAHSIAQLGAEIRAPHEPPIFVTVAQALGKADKFDVVVQHGTEAGASRFVPIIADRSIVEIPKDRIEARLARWRAIAKGAAEQSFRSRIPKIEAPVNLPECLVATQRAGITVLLLDTSEACVSLHEALDRVTSVPEQLAICVGPEGGWSESEVDQVSTAGIELVSLGQHVLRTETAALVAISQLLYHFSRPGEGTSCVS